MVLKQDLELSDSVKQILDALPDGLTIYSDDATLIWINEKACELINVKREDLLGLNVSEVATLPCVESLQTSDFSSDSNSVDEFREKFRALSSYSSPGYMVFNNGVRMLYSGAAINDENGDLKYAVYTLRATRELDESRRRISELEKLTSLYRDQLAKLHGDDASDNVISASSKMDQVFARARKIARLESSVLITGETGVGKNVLAQYIHGQSPRAKQPFIQINCACLPETLVESELFGYAEGSFTGASRKGRRGLIELANGGTLFLDEIAEMSEPMQAKLLSVVEDRTLRRLGSERWHKIDVRIIAATARDPKELRSGTAGLRSDLYYRLTMSSIHIPPLRQRKDDIEALSEHFMAEFNDANGANLVLHPELVECLQQLPLPGNGREIRNLIWQIAVEYMPESDPLMQVVIPPDARHLLKTNETSEIEPATNDVPNKYAGEAANLARLAERCDGDVYKMAKNLDVHRTTVVRKLKRFGIDYRRRTTQAEL